MIGYPISYDDNLEYDNGFTSDVVVSKVSDYWTLQRKTAFQRGFNFGAFVFTLGSMVLKAQPAVASDVSAAGTQGSNAASCPPPAGPDAGAGSPVPTPTPAKPGGFANVSSADRGAYIVSSLGICGVAMKTGAFWVGFVCAAAVIVGARMASVPANSAV